MTRLDQPTAGWSPAHLRDRAPLTCARSTETSRAMRKARSWAGARRTGATVHRGTAEGRLHVVER
jgi:hypothetical protein